MANKITKAGGNIVQADWLQTDPSKMDYIHNKPDVGLSEDQVVETVFGMGKYTPDLDFVFDNTTRTWNRNPIGVYYGTSHINFANNCESYGCPPVTVNWWVVKGEEISVTPEGYPTYLKQTLIVGAMERTWERYWSPDNSNKWSNWRTTMQWPGKMYSHTATGVSPDALVGFAYYNDYGSIQPTNYVIGSWGGNIPIRASEGDLSVPLVPLNDNSAASKSYVEKWHKKKRTTKEVVEKIKLVDLQCMASDYAWNYGRITFESYTGLSYDLDPQYPITIAVQNLPSTLFNSQYDEVIQIIGTNMSGEWPILAKHTPSSPTWENFGPMTYHTFGGPPDDEILLYVGFLSGDILSNENLNAYLQHLNEIELIVRYTPREAEGEDLSVLETELYSDTELEYKIAITELNILDFVSCEGHLDEWTISFMAGDEDPLVIVPENIVWAVAEPVFEAYKKYIVTFKKIMDKYVGIWTVID